MVVAALTALALVALAFFVVLRGRHEVPLGPPLRHPDQWPTGPVTENGYSFLRSRSDDAALALRGELPLEAHMASCPPPQRLVVPVPQPATLRKLRAGDAPLAERARLLSAHGDTLVRLSSLRCRSLTRVDLAFAATHFTDHWVHSRGWYDPFAWVGEFVYLAPIDQLRILALAARGEHEEALERTVRALGRTLELAVEPALLGTLEVARDVTGDYLAVAELLRAAAPEEARTERWYQARGELVALLRPPKEPGLGRALASAYLSHYAALEKFTESALEAGEELAFELDPPRTLARLDDYWRALEDHAFASAPAPAPPEPARFLNDAGAEWLRFGSWDYPERIREALRARAALTEQLHRARQRWAAADVQPGGP